MWSKGERQWAALAILFSKRRRRTGVLVSDWAPGERAWAVALATGMLAALLYPVRQNWLPEGRRTQGFPLSYYPMFSIKRGATHSVPYLMGVRADGSRCRLPGRLIGSGGMNQVRRQLMRVVDEGRAEQLATLIAARVATRKNYAGVVGVQIVQGLYCLDELMLSREANPRQEDVLTEVEVIR